MFQSSCCFIGTTTTIIRSFGFRLDIGGMMTHLPADTAGVFDLAIARMRSWADPAMALQSRD